MQIRQFWIEQSPRHNWLVTSALALATVLLWKVDLQIGQLPNNAGPPLCFMPSMIGALLLPPLHEAALCLVFFVHWSITRIASDQWTPRAILSLLGPIPLMLALGWLAHLRLQSKSQQRQLVDQQGELERKLQRCLQASALTHELGQPLSQLVLQTRLVQFELEQEDQIPPAAIKPLEGLQQSGEQIQDLIRAISRLLSDNALPEHRVNLSEVTQRCLQPLEQTARANGIDLRLMGLHQSAYALGDAKQLEIAISNLLRNATQSLLNSPPAQRSLVVAITQTSSQVVVSIADSGKGLPSTDPRDLTMNSTKPGGMGLGLLMVSNIARRHGGELTLSASTDLGGAEVRLSLPAAPSSPRL